MIQGYKLSLIDMIIEPKKANKDFNIGYSKAFSYCTSSFNACQKISQQSPPATHFSTDACCSRGLNFNICFLFLTLTPSLSLNLDLSQL